MTPARRTNDSCKDPGPVQEHGEGPFCFFFARQVGRIDRELAVGVYGVRELVYHSPLDIEPEKAKRRRLVGCEKDLLEHFPIGSKHFSISVSLSISLCPYFKE